MNKSHFRKPATKVAVTIALLFAISSCSPTTTSDSANIGLDNVEVTTESTNVPTRQPLPARQVSLLDEFRNILWNLDFGEESFGREINSFTRQIEIDRNRQEHMIAQCMGKLGFRYLPNQIWRWLHLPTNAWQPDDPAWVARYGYGWVTAPPDVSNNVIRFLTHHRRDGNPNVQVVAELSADDRAGWHRALLTDDNNCTDQSWARINFEREMLNEPEWQSLSNAITQMRDDLRWSISDADQRWASCMSDAGYPGFDRQWEASEFIRNQSATSNTPTESLHRQEVEMATADLNCRISTQFGLRHNSFIEQVENQFITDHRSELESFRAVFEQQ